MLISSIPKRAKPLITSKENKRELRLVAGRIVSPGDEGIRLIGVGLEFPSGNRLNVSIKNERWEDYPPVIIKPLFMCINHTRL